MKIDLKGNTYQEGTPTPDSPQDIQVVSGDNEIKVYDENIFTGELVNKTVSGGGYLDSTGRICGTTFIPVVSGKTYKLSFSSSKIS